MKTRRQLAKTDERSKSIAQFDQFRMKFGRTKVVGDVERKVEQKGNSKRKTN